MHREAIQLDRPLRDCQIRSSRYALTGESRNASAAKDAAAEQADAEQLRQQQLLQQNQVMQQTMESIQEALTEYEQRREQSLGELQLIAVELAVMAASHVIYEQLDKNALGVEQLVADTITQLALHESATLRLHPQDLTLLQQKIGDGDSKWDDQQIKLIADSKIERGAVRLETNSGRIVLSDVVSRLSAVRYQWMENIDDTQTERRAVSDAAEQLRRFPDRRETA